MISISVWGLLLALHLCAFAPSPAVLVLFRARTQPVQHFSTYAVDRYMNKSTHPCEDPNSVGDLLRRFAVLFFMDTIRQTSWEIFHVFNPLFIATSSSGGRKLNTQEVTNSSATSTAEILFTGIVLVIFKNLSVGMFVYPWRQINGPEISIHTDVTGSLDGNSWNLVILLLTVKRFRSDCGHFRTAAKESTLYASKYKSFRI